MFNFDVDKILILCVGIAIGGIVATGKSLNANAEQIGTPVECVESVIVNGQAYCGMIKDKNGIDHEFSYNQAIGIDVSYVIETDDLAPCVNHVTVDNESECAIFNYRGEEYSTEFAKVFHYGVE